jgi:hypothetical protein
VRELFRLATHGNTARKAWLRNVTDTPLCQFYGKLREMNTHRSVVSAGMSYRLKPIDGKIQIDLGVVFGQESSNKHMSPLYFSIDGAALDRQMAEVYRDLQTVEVPPISITATATKYIDELRTIFVDGVAQGTFG